MSSILLNSAVIPLQSTSFCKDGLKVAISHLLHEYSSGYCIIHTAYLVKFWCSSWTVFFPCLIVSNLLDACLCVKVFKKCFCNPSITALSNQFSIGRSCLLIFLVYHSSASPLSLAPKYSTWKSALSLPKRLFSLNHHSIPAMKVSYTSRSGLPEYSSGDGILVGYMHAPRSIQMNSCLLFFDLCFYFTHSIILIHFYESLFFPIFFSILFSFIRAFICDAALYICV